MNRSDALRALFAAQEDPVVAAWAAVLHQHEMSPMCDVSPYEPWAAFQDFFAHGLISADRYNATDHRVFFSGTRSMSDEVHRVLCQLRRRQPALESSMSKSKFPDNPFGASTELVTKSAGGLAARATMPAAHAHAPLNPFSPSREVAPPEKRMNLEPFQSKSKLACQEPSVLGDCDVQIFCCRTPLVMNVQDMQADGPDGISAGQVQVIDSILHGTCGICHREHHHSVAEVIEHDRYR